MKYITLEEVCEQKTSNISQKNLKENHGNYPIYGASGLIKNINFYIQDKEYIAIVKDGSGVGRTMLLPPKSSVIGTMQYIIPNNLLNIKYLYYAIVSMELSKYSSGATIPHIYFKDYKKEKIALISENEQKKIVNILDIIIDIINKKKSQINLLEELVKSRFIEMFGDPIKNEKGWKTEEIMKVCSLKSGGTPSKKNVEYFNGDIPWITTKTLSKKTIAKVDVNDFITQEGVTKSSTKIIPKNSLLLGIRVGVGKLSINKIDMCTNQDIVSLVGLEKSFNINFIYEQLRKYEPYLKKYERGATIKGINTEMVKNIKIIIPPLSLQNEFSQFVEKTDKLKFEAEKSLKEMENLYESLMQKFFKQN